MLTRRRFLCWAGAAGGSGAVAKLLWDHSSSTLEIPDATVPAADLPVTRSAWALGADVSITVLATPGAEVEAGIEAAFSELKLVESVMSLYRPDSQLCRLNQTAVLDNPHPYLIEVLQVATEMSRRTDGAFDITVQPLWSLFAASRQENRLPDAALVERTRQRVDWRRVEISDNRVRLHGTGSAITLNGIAQGYAADRALQALRAHGVQHALLDAGEVASLGRKGDRTPWRVGIQHPRQVDAFLALADLSGRCLATSGDYATPFRDDFRFHHIFDPRTGWSPAELASVSIAARTALEADALSTAVFVLGPEEGSELVHATPGADAMLVLKDGRTRVTSTFPQSEIG